MSKALKRAEEVRQTEEDALISRITRETSVELETQTRVERETLERIEREARDRGTGNFHSMVLEAPKRFLYDDESRHSAALRCPERLKGFSMYASASGLTNPVQKSVQKLKPQLKPSLI
jgi:hypothetical protein